ncbi:centromere protein K isoform X2 [Octopus bimaculoides]|uniref:centromere protein K isoform X2 n=1 Tax=Octopus bimaculoides TaxID=37653 RepID=UPI0022E03723|nr:centromere protein K isoform X2 [Octopus bimaculoides]
MLSFFTNQIAGWSLITISYPGDLPETVTESKPNKVLHDACEDLWAEILKAHKAGSQKTSSPDEPIPDVTGKYLQAAVEIGDNIPEGLPVDSDFRQKYVIQQLKSTIREQENLLCLMDLMETTLINQLQQEEEDDMKMKSITKALTESSSKRAEAGGINENKYVQEIKHQIEMMKEERLWLSKSLFSTTKDKEPYSLMKIIMTLIDRNLNHPHDTYITVNSRFSLDYLELLKECRIIECHPKYELKVRLIPHILP